jgi:hypothetical protein
MHNKILINAGFYLLLFFSLAVTIVPEWSYVMAAGVFLIWFVDLLIFKEPEFIRLPLFYPIVIFNTFLVITWLIHRIYGWDFRLVYLGFFSLFYFIVPGFIISSEKRRMILWTFIAGAIISATIFLISWWNAAFEYSLKPAILSPVLVAEIALAFCMLIAIYAEAPAIGEKVFSGLVSLPLALAIILSFDKPAAFVLIFTLLTAGFLSDKSILIPFVALVIIFFTGAMGINYYIQKNLKLTEYENYARHPAAQLQENRTILTDISFFGSPLEGDNDTATSDPYFLKLIKNAGPSSLLIFLWILIVRAEEAYSKRRKINSPQPRAYHLTVVLIVGAIVIFGIYSSVYLYPSIILSTWLVLGISEV